MYMTPGELQKGILIAGITLFLITLSAAAQNTIAFTASTQEGCVPLSVNFTDQSVGEITSRIWNLGNGNISNHNPDVGANFTIAGIYHITLTVTFSNGQVESLTKEISVYDKPSSDFISDILHPCEAAAIRFSPSSSGANNSNTIYEWDFGDGSYYTGALPTHQYKQSGQYLVKLTTSNGTACKSSFSAQVLVPEAEQPLNLQMMTVPSNACVLAPLKFEGLVSGRAPGTYSIHWDFGDNTSEQKIQPTHSYAQPGTYKVNLIAVSNSGVCSDTVSRQITIQPKVKADFTADNLFGCTPPLYVQFTNQSSGSGNLTSKWYFGDNSTSTDKDPEHNFTTAGSKTITLVVNDGSGLGGCSDSLVKPQYINIIKPTANFYYSPSGGCGPLEVKLTAGISNTSPADPVIRYTWDWGDNSPPATTPAGNTTHTYTTAGEYDITLTVETQNGCISISPAHRITVTATCTDDGVISEGGAFTTSRNCTDKYNILFNAAGEDYTFSSWNFGDLSPVSTENPVTHRFPDTQKEWMVTLTRRNNNTGQLESITKSIRIIDEKAAFTITNPNTCINTDVKLNTESIDPYNISKFIWAPGEGIPRITITNNPGLGAYNIGNTTYRYTQSGTFLPKLIITDKLGCMDSTATDEPVTISGPKVDFMATPSVSCSSPLPVSFTSNATTTPGASIVSWQWSFGDDNTTFLTTQDSTVHHTYVHNEDYKAYTVRLKIKDSEGCENEISRAGIIQVTNVKAAFTSTDTLVCGQYDISFSNNSTANNATYTWYWGDGSTTITTNKNPVIHTYGNDGIYTIKLVLNPHDGGCADSTVKNSYIKIVSPHAGFTIGDTLQCVPAAIGFENTSSYSLDYEWIFSNSTGYTQKTPPPQTYTSPGVYAVTLIAKGLNGCTDTATRTFRIKGPEANLSFTGNGGCTPYTFEAKISGTDISAYSWDFGDGTAIHPSAADSVVTHVYTFAGSFTPSVILTNQEGCTNNISVPKIIKAGAAGASFTMNKNKFCDSGTVVFTNTSVTGNNFTRQWWDFGDGSGYNGAQPPPKRYNTPGTYNVTLSVETDFGCSDTITADFPVTISAKPALSITGSDNTCAGDTIHLEAAIRSENYIPSMSWIFNRQVISDAPILNFALPDTPGSINLLFAAVTAQGCADTVQKNVTIHALPVPGAIAADTLVCAGNAVELHASGGGTYYWQSGQPVENAASPDAIAIPSKTAEYIVTVTSPFGCIQKDTVVIKTAEPVALVAAPVYSICRGSTVQLSASGNTGSFSWYPSTGINDPGTANPVASPDITTSYLVIGHSQNICPDDSAMVNVKVLDNPTVHLSGDTAVPAGVPFTLFAQTSSNVAQYQWVPAEGLSCSSCATPSALPEDSQLYLLNVSSPEGCKGTDSIKLTLLCNKEAIYIPTAFTPNGDRLNDWFYIRGFGLKSINYFRIFDRWGREVFSRKHFAANVENMGWNGNLPGGSLPAATSSYAYIAEVICSEGIPVIMRGTVTLIR